MDMAMVIVGINLCYSMVCILRMCSLIRMCSLEINLCYSMVCTCILLLITCILLLITCILLLINLCYSMVCIPLACNVCHEKNFHPKLNKQLYPLVNLN